MKFKGLCTLSVLLVTSLNFISGHSYHLDQYPDFEPLPDFVMERFLGRWYAVQMSSLSSRFLVFDFTNTEEPNNTNCINCVNCKNCVNCRDCTDCNDCTNCTNCKGCRSCVGSSNCRGCRSLTSSSNCENCRSCTNCQGCTNCKSCTKCSGCSNCNSCTNCTNLRNCNSCTNCTKCPNLNELKQISENSTTGVDKHSNYRYTVELKADPIVPSKMSVSFPLKNSTMVVFATDYVNYAGVHFREKIPFGHRHSVTILSRSKVLDKTYLDQMRNRIMSVHPYELSTVDQEKCNDKITYITYSVK